MAFPLLLIAAGGVANEFRERKQRRARLAEAEMARQGFYSSEQEVFNSEIDSLMESAANPDDVLQLRQLREAGNRGFRAGLSQDEDIQKMGIQALQEVMKQRVAYAQRQEVDSITRESSEAGRERDLEALNYTRDLSFSDEIRKNIVDPYFDVRSSFGKSMALLDTGDRLGYDAAFTMAIQALDGSVVRDQERLSYTGSNGLVTQAVDMFNRWSGQKTPEALAALKNMTAATLNGVTDVARRELATYREQVDAYGGNADRVFSVVPDELFETIPIDRSMQRDQESRPSSEVGEMESVQPSALGRTLASGVQTAIETAGDVRRILAGTEIKRGPDGTLYEVTQDGTATPITQSTFFEREDGKTYQIGEGANGPEWKPAAPPEDDGSFLQDVSTIWRPELRARPGESRREYRERLRRERTGDRSVRGAIQR